MSLRTDLAHAATGLAQADPLAGKLKSFDDAVDAIRKRIVATTEGGAITGEERLREHTDQLYGAVLSWEGKPTTYQQENIGALEAEFEGIHHNFAALTAKTLPDLNKQLGNGKRGAIKVKPIDENEDEDAEQGSSNPPAGRFDPDQSIDRQSLPVNFRLLR
jgi:hypothetical protein